MMLGVKMRRFLILTILFPCWSLAQAMPSLAMEGGSGFIYSKSAEIHGRRFLGLSVYGIYSSIQLPPSSESVLSGVAVVACGAADRLEFSLVFYAEGKSVIADETISDTRVESGLGESQFAMKFRMPFRFASVDWAVRMAIHVPMNINFASHPSHPYDSDVYSLEIMGLQTFQISRNIQIHLNEGYRWQGLRPDYVEEVDLGLFTLCRAFNWHEKWTGFISVTSNIEADDNIRPLKDRMVMTQGVQYYIGDGFTHCLAVSLRLNQERSDPLQTRTKNYRLFCRIS